MILLYDQRSEVITNLFMKNKNKILESKNTNHSRNLQAVRQHLKNKLIEIGLSCHQHATDSNKMHKKHSNYATEDHNLPIILSFKNTLSLKKDNNDRCTRNTGEIFSQRELFIDSQSFLGGKINKSTERPKEKPPNSFREKFEKKLLQEVQVYKMEQMLPASLKRALRKEKLRTQADQTIFIFSLKHNEKRNKETVHISPPGKMRIIRSKTEEHSYKQPKAEIKKTQSTQYKQLAPWEQSDQIQNWLQHF